MWYRFFISSSALDSLGCHSINVVRFARSELDGCSAVAVTAAGDNCLDGTCSEEHVLSGGGCVTLSGIETDVIVLV